MDAWAPVFKCTPADVEELPEMSVSNFVCSVKSGDDDWDVDTLNYCKGYSIDLNGDGIKNRVFIIPWLGSGLANHGYDVHFRVSVGTHGWTNTVIEGYGVSKADLVNVAGKTYFRRSTFYGGFEKSKHNHWVYQVFSFDRKGAMICSDGDFGKLFPAVTIYYLKPKFKQIELTEGDLREIEGKTMCRIRQARPVATEWNGNEEEFDPLNYKALWNDDTEKAGMVINPASKKREAEGWRPLRELTAKESAKWVQILTERFGQPAKCRSGYGSFVYVWRFEGDEWLSVGISTEGNMGGDPIAIHHWAWRKPALSIYTEDEMKEREYPVIKIEDEGLPAAAFFEFFDPYSFTDEAGSTLVTEFNATAYLAQSSPRCTAELDVLDHKYTTWTKFPDGRRGEITHKGDCDGGHEDECCVGIVQFRKRAPSLFMCDSLLYVDGSIMYTRACYLFEVYDRDIWSCGNVDKPIKSKMVRYLGTFLIDDVQQFREKWIKKHGRPEGIRVDS